MFLDLLMSNMMNVHNGPSIKSTLAAILSPCQPPMH
ncbi:MAG: hypothetical protein ACI9FO_001512 [Methylophagaceae bacterium]